VRSTKRYTNTTFTHRVDHDGGRHRGPQALASPRLCSSCGALYRNRRWTIGGDVATLLSRPSSDRPALVVCPACLAKAAGRFSGEVRISGAFVAAHHDEIVTLLHTEGNRAAEDNPLARVVDLQSPSADHIVVRTTTEHLAQRLGHALQKAFDGDVHYGFSHENKFAHVTWSRD
jgi:hypothetical protein